MRLAAGNRDGYRQVCAILLERSDKTTNLVEALDTARTLALAPGAVTNAAGPLRLVERRVCIAAEEPSFSGDTGAALYRAGKYDMAVQRLNEAIALFGLGGTTQDWLYLAMAQHRLGQRDEAARSLAKAVSLGDEKAIAAFSWTERLDLKVVREEAARSCGGRALDSGDPVPASPHSVARPVWCRA